MPFSKSRALFLKQHGLPNIRKLTKINYKEFTENFLSEKLLKKLKPTEVTTGLDERMGKLSHCSNSSKGLSKSTNFWESVNSW